MSMLDVAKFLSFSNSLDHASEKDGYFNLSVANSGRLFSCLYSDWRRELPETRMPMAGEGD